MLIRLNECVAISDSGLLFNARTGESFSVNPLGLTILQMIRNNRQKAEIRQSLLEEYDVNAETLDSHFEEFLLFLKRFKLIEFLPAS